MTEVPARIQGFALPGITLLTAPSGGGERPMLEWESVDGAAWYQPIVITSSGETYWNWVTEDASVFVSGVESDVTRTRGPRVSAGMIWAVLERRPVARSGHYRRFRFQNQKG